MENVLEGCLAFLSIVMKTGMLHTGGAYSRGYRRGERGREAPKSLLEKELIEACSNIGGSVVLIVAYYRMGPIATPLKEARLLLL